MLTDAGSIEASGQGDGSNWEQELLQLQIASSALIKPLGNTESAPIADPRIIAEVTHQADQARTGSPFDGGKLASQSESGCRLHQGSLDLQTVAGAAGQDDAGLPHVRIQAGTGEEPPSCRSISSPFFAIAQQYVSPVAPTEGERPLRAPPPPLLTTLSVPGVDEDAGSSVYAGVALQTQTDTAEAILAQSSFSSLNSSPTLPDHPLVAIPLSPQTTAKGFVTADSFQHEPGHTLFDCTDPTPNNSLDLDDPGLKNRLAQLLPNFPFPSHKPVRRNLSAQMSGLEILSEAADGEDESQPRAGVQFSLSDPATAPGSSIDGSACEGKITRSKPTPAAGWNRLHLFKAGSLSEKEHSQTGDAVA